MTGKKLTDRRKSSINVCYLIDVSPERYTGGGQVHLLHLVVEMQAQNSKLKTQIFGGLGSNTLIRLLWAIWVIPQVIFHNLFRQRFDLIHAHSIPAMAAGKIISLILGIPIVVTIHGNVISEKDSPFRTERTVLSRLLEKWILTKIKYDAQITVSRNFLEVPNINKNVVYIPNGVDLSRFRRDKLKVKSEKLKVILFVGRKGDPVKGFEVLKEAMEKVNKEISDVELRVVGGDVPAARVAAEYARADLFVLPSLSEGFPLTLLEAWAAKLPVVATKVGEVQELVRDGVNGYLVQPGDWRKLGSAIIRALRSKKLAKLGRNGYNVAKRFSWKTVAEQTIAVYKDVLLNER